MGSKPFGIIIIGGRLSWNRVHGVISALNVCTIEYDKVFNANFPIVDVDKEVKILENTLCIFVWEVQNSSLRKVLHVQPEGKIGSMMQM